MVILIFRAHTKDGKDVFAYQAERKTDYFCPHCNQVVRLRAGMVVTHHFYHLKKCNCLYTGESMNHLKMKEQVIKYFQSYNMQIEVQVIPNRRTDILLQKNDKKVAVECQVSPITVEEWRKRTLDYSKRGIFVLWIFHID